VLDLLRLLVILMDTLVHVECPHELLVNVH